MAEDVDIRVNADTRPFEEALANLQRLAASFGTQMAGAFRSAAIDGKDLDTVLRRIGLNLAGMALRQGLAPLASMAGPVLGPLVSGLGGILPFAKGGVVRAPTAFAAGGTLGLMGEAGAEAILPLRRGSDGRLGVASDGGGGAINITFNVTAADAGSFRKSESQITGMLARAVSRGSRTL